VAKPARVEGDGMTLTFDGLLELSPQLRGLREQAKSAARESKREWYIEWVWRCGTARIVAGRLSWEQGIDAEETEQVIREGLADAYRVARARERRRAGTGDPPRPVGQGSNPPKRGARPDHTAACFFPGCRIVRPNFQGGGHK